MPSSLGGKTQARGGKNASTLKQCIITQLLVSCTGREGFEKDSKRERPSARNNGREEKRSSPAPMAKTIAGVRACVRACVRECVRVCENKFLTNIHWFHTLTAIARVHCACALERVHFRSANDCTTSSFSDAAATLARLCKRKNLLLLPNRHPARNPLTQLFRRRCCRRRRRCCRRRRRSAAAAGVAALPLHQCPCNERCSHTHRADRAPPRQHLGNAIPYCTNHCAREGVACQIGQETVRHAMRKLPFWESLQRS